MLICIILVVVLLNPHELLIHILKDIVIQMLHQEPPCRSIILIYLEFPLAIYLKATSKMVLANWMVHFLEVCDVFLHQFLLVLLVQETSPRAFVMRNFNDVFVQFFFIHACWRSQSCKGNSWLEISFLETNNFQSLALGLNNCFEGPLHHGADQKGFPVPQISLKVIQFYYPVPEWLNQKQKHY